MREMIVGVVGVVGVTSVYRGFGIIDSRGHGRGMVGVYFFIISPLKI